MCVSVRWEWCHWVLAMICHECWVGVQSLTTSLNYQSMIVDSCVCLCVLVSGGSDATGYWQWSVTSAGLGCKVWRWIAIANHYGTTGTRADQDTWQVVLTTLSNHWNGLDMDLVLFEFDDEVILLILLFVCYSSHVEMLSLAFNSLMFTQRRSIAKTIGCFQRRLFVCLFVNTITSQRVNIGWWNFVGRCIVR